MPVTHASAAPYLDHSLLVSKHYSSLELKIPLVQSASCSPCSPLTQSATPHSSYDRENISPLPARDFSPCMSSQLTRSFCHQPYAVNVFPDGYITPCWEDSFLSNGMEMEDEVVVPTQTMEPQNAFCAAEDFPLVICTKGAKRVIRAVPRPLSCRWMNTSPIVAPCGVNQEDLAASPSHICMVRTKCRTLKCSAQCMYEVGDLVLIDGDEGFDIAEVTASLPVATLRRGCAHPKLCVYRRTTMAEASHYFNVLGYIELGVKNMLDQLHDASKDGVQMVAQYHSTYWEMIRDMSFVDVEVQADHKKIYVFFKADQPLRFRELAKTLHAFYGCRIWLHQLDRADTPNNSANTSMESRRSQRSGQKL